MKQGLYCIYDNVALRFAPPFLADNHEVARRILIQSLQQKSQLTDFPEHFSLMRVGLFDSEVGVVESEKLALICGVQQLLQANASTGPAPTLVAGNGSKAG